MSQSTLNARIGCADGLVGKWECGMRRASPRSFAEWAKALSGTIGFIPDGPEKTYAYQRHDRVTNP